MAKEEIKFVKKKGEKGLKQVFNEDDGIRGQLGVQKKNMKRSGQVTYNNYIYYNINLIYNDNII